VLVVVEDGGLILEIVFVLRRLDHCYGIVACVVGYYAVAEGF
jgi:hypothetical protein